MVNENVREENPDFLDLLQIRIDLFRDLVNASDRKAFEEAADRLEEMYGMRLFSGTRNSSPDDRHDDRPVKNNGRALDFDDDETKNRAEKSLQDFNEVIKRIVTTKRPTFEKR